MDVVRIKDADHIGKEECKAAKIWDLRPARGVESCRRSKPVTLSMVQVRAVPVSSLFHFRSSKVVQAKCYTFSSRDISPYLSPKDLSDELLPAKIYRGEAVDRRSQLKRLTSQTHETFAQYSGDIMIETAVSWAAGKLEPNKIGLPTSPSSTAVQSRVLQAAAKLESQPSGTEETQDISRESTTAGENLDLSEA
ncbi:hypothetical protein ACLOJK_011711 [Asimina triloba]